METLKQSKSINSIDLMKFVACFFVITIHADPVPELPVMSLFLRNVISRTFLMFFFISAGYLFFRRVSAAEKENQPHVFRSYIRRIFRLWAVWSVVYFPGFLVLKREDLKGFQLRTLLDWLLEILNSGTFYHLWFLAALLVGIILVYGLYLMNLSPSAAVFITTVLYLIGLLGHSYDFLLDGAPVLSQLRDCYLEWFGTTRNGVFFAPIFLTLGWWLSAREKAKSLRLPVTGLIASVVLLAGEVLWLADKTEYLEMYVMLPFTGLFCFWSTLYIKTGESAIWKKLRTYSTQIFLIHPIMIIAFQILSGILDIKGAFIRYCFVAVSSLIGSVILVELRKKRGFSWIKWFL